MTLRSVLGQDAEEVLRALAAIEAASSNGNEISLPTIESILSRTPHINALKGLADNIQGELFATLVALAWSSHGYSVEREKPLRDAAGRSLPIDVVATNGAITVLVECKGRKADSLNYRSDLESLFHDRCKAASETWHKDGKPVPSKAIFITTGNFQNDAKTYAHSTRKSHGILCETWGRRRLLRFIKDTHQSHLLRVVDQYY